MNTNRMLLQAALALAPAIAAAQTDNHTAASPAAVAAKAPTSEARKWLDQLKSLNGTWQGSMHTDPPIPQMKGDDTTTITMRVTSLGNAIVHEMRSPKRPDDPITMFYVENEKLMLTHYCDSGNRPRMSATLSPDGKTLSFEFLDITGPLNYGHMHRGVFTFIDADHHTEEWTWVLPNGNKLVARSDLHRVKPSA